VKSIIVVVVLLLFSILAFFFFQTKSEIYTLLHTPFSLIATEPSPLPPRCKALKVLTPLENEEITSPLEVKVVVDNSSPYCNWRVYEAQAGTIALTDGKGTVLGTSVLKTEDNWMQSEPVNYTASIDFTKPTNTTKAMLVITEENPKGSSKVQTITHPLLFK
jgi:hypothetical protein